jgi:hypothetical protein
MHNPLHAQHQVQAENAKYRQRRAFGSMDGFLQAIHLVSGKALGVQ